MTEKKRELLTIDLETWNEMVREDERKSIKIARLENALESIGLFEKIIDEFIEEESDEDEVDEEATLKMWEEEQDE